MKIEDPVLLQALIEDIQTQVKVIAEAQGVLAEGFARHEGRLERLESRSDLLQVHVAVLEKRVDARLEPGGA